MSTRILEAISVTAEMTGTQLSGPAMRGMEIELDAFPEQQVLHALARCRRELKHRLTLADILERLENADGRPTADEAWATALQAFDESSTVLLNDEISEAMAIARPIYNERDKTGARMAFRDAYERLVQRNREARLAVKWWPSLGQDPRGREIVIRAAVDKGLLGHEHLRALPPPMEPDGEKIAALIAGPKSVNVGEKLKQLRDELRAKEMMRKSQF